VNWDARSIPDLRREGACCVALLLGIAVLLLPVCGPILCAHPCCPDHEPHCTVSADLANACPAQAQAEAAAVQAMSRDISAPPKLLISAWSATNSHAGLSFLPVQAESPARSAPLPLRI